MTPLALFLVACAAVFLCTIQTEFSALMRLSLRLIAERSGRPDRLGEYLDDPLLLFMPVRLLLGLVTAGATVLLARAFGTVGFTLTSVIVAVIAFVVFCELLLPLALVGRDPERMLEILLPGGTLFALLLFLYQRRKPVSPIVE